MGTTNGTTKLFTTGDVTRMTGISRTHLRWLELAGVITPERASNSLRLYTSEMIAALVARTEERKERTHRDRDSPDARE